MISDMGLDEVTAEGWWVQHNSVARPAIHELLFDRGIGHPPPLFLAAVLARRALGQDFPERDLGRAVIWIDPLRTIYPPVVVAAGIPQDRFYLLRPRSADLVRAAVECLRCEGVATVIAMLPPRMSRVEVRRLQLAAERGKSMGVFLRDARGGVAPDVYAATSRWLISPAPGERTVQRWHVRLIHGHGRNLGQSFCLEKGRASFDISFSQANPLHPFAPLAHPPAVPAFSRPA